MISSPNADEAVVKDTFARDFGFEKPEDAVGKTLEFLAAPGDSKEGQSEEPPNFFGLPLEDDPGEQSNSNLVAKRFRIIGVWSAEVKEGRAGWTSWSISRCANLPPPAGRARMGAGASRPDESGDTRARA